MKSNDRNYKLTVAQKEVVQLLAKGKSVSEAAAAAKLDAETIRQWYRKDIAFMAAYNDAISDHHRVVSRKLAEGKAKAFERLAKLVDDKDKGVALKAASVLARIDFPEPKGETDPEKLEASLNFFGPFF